jgi:hypothetical protein
MRPIYLKESEANEPPAHRRGIYPVPPPLVQGGQGRSDDEVLYSGKVLATATIAGVAVLAAFFIAATLIKLFV